MVTLKREPAPLEQEAVRFQGAWQFPVLIGLMLVIGCLGAAVWYSCYLHGKQPL